MAFLMRILAITCFALLGACNETAIGPVQDTQEPDNQPDGGNTAIERGRKLFHETHGCNSCHGNNGDGGLGGGPALAGKQFEEAYFRESLVTPEAKLAAGYKQTGMPPYNLSENEFADLFAYVSSLK